MKLLIPLTLAMAMICGCASQRPGEVGKIGPAAPQHYALELRDKLGNPVAEGDIELPVPMPTGDSSFQGGWHLTTSLDFGPSVLRSGQYAATLAAGLYSFNLSPDVPDDSVHLAGLLLDGTIQGRWTHETLGGEREMGQFTMRRQGQPKP
jgi:hypothetical protein